MSLLELPVAYEIHQSRFLDEGQLRASEISTELRHKGCKLEYSQQAFTRKTLIQISKSMTFKSRLYDLFIAKRYDGELAEITEEFRRICIERTGIKKGDVVLDLGFVTGLNQPIISALVGPTGKVIGVDASEKMLSQAKTRAEKQDYANHLELIHGDLRNLDELIEGPVDAVIATLIFSVVPDWRNVFAESFNLLKPGGRYGRPGFEPLKQNAADDFVLEYHPPDAEVQFYVAHGSKPD